MMTPMNPLGWMVADPPREVVPMNDIRDHVPGMRCACQPEVDEYLTVVHNSFDRREDYEQKRRRHQ